MSTRVPARPPARLSSRVSAGFAVSLCLHGGLLYAATNVEPPPPEKKPEKVELRVVEAKKPEPPPPPPPPEKPPEPEPPKPEPAPKKRELAPPPKADTPPPPPPPSAPPPPPPQGFSVDLESTVAAGPGPAVVAVEGGGNLFADPSKGGDPGKRQAAPPPPPRGSPDGVEGGTGPASEPPEWLISDEERKPPYNERATALEVEGTVVLQLTVGEDGRVQAAKVLKGLGYGLDEASVDWAKKKYRFKPGRRNGKPVAMTLTVNLNFELER